MNQGTKIAGFLGVLVGILQGCGGAPVKKVDIEEPQYKIVDATGGGREYWLDHPQDYAEKSDLDVKTYLYVVHDAQSADKRTACEVAQSQTLEDFAKQVSTFVDSSIARASTDSSTQDTSTIAALSSSSNTTSRISNQITKAVVGGVEKVKQYWEQRDYSQVKGPKSIYTCWVLSRIKHAQVAEMIERAKLVRFTENPALKAQVETKLQGLDQQFIQKK